MRSGVPFWRNLDVKARVIVIGVIVVVVGAAIVGWSFFDAYLAPLLFNSRIERLREKDLPKIVVKNGNTIYCRMKADDFEFPLPPGSRAAHPILTSGGFDTVDGSVEAGFESGHPMTPSEYDEWLKGRVQVGGWINAEPVPDGLLIKFHYFGDR